MKLNLLLVLLLSSATIGMEGEALAVQQPQYGFAHRVNDWDQIDDALASNANAIELDICYSTTKNEWVVSHYDAHVCYTASAEYLDEWMDRLALNLGANPQYASKFTMLWVDIKTPGLGNLMDAADIIRQFAPPNLWVMYDINNLNDDSRSGFDRIVHNLKPSESVSALAESTADVQDIYNLYKQRGFKRGAISHGHGINIDENILTEANNAIYHNPNDPYRLKKVFTWTNRTQSTMEDYINPTHSYHTDGQIVGEWGTQWASYMSYIATNFVNAVSTYSSTQRMAHRYDNPWALSYLVTLQSDLTSGSGAQTCVDISGWSSAHNGSNAQLWTCNGTGAQDFVYSPTQQTLRLASDPSYCLDVSGSNPADGTNIQMWSCNGGSGQKFEYRLGDKSLRSMLDTNKCVDVAWASSSNGTNIQLVTCWGGGGNAAQRFSMIGKQFSTAGNPDPQILPGTTLVEIKSALAAGSSARCMDIDNPASLNYGSNVRLWECTHSIGQQFLFDPAAGTIKSKNNSNFCVDVSNGSTANGANIQMWGCNGSTPQRFEYRSGDGTLRSLLDTSKCLDVSYANIANGTNIQLMNCNGSNAQKFSME